VEKDSANCKEGFDFPLLPECSGHFPSWRPGITIRISGEFPTAQCHPVMSPVPVLITSFILFLRPNPRISVQPWGLFNSQFLKNKYRFLLIDNIKRKVCQDLFSPFFVLALEKQCSRFFLE
jgi:hypothetical protein